jgi:hypothetical protein
MYGGLDMLEVRVRGGVEVMSVEKRTRNVKQ